jgi:hypothetical protein
MRINSNTNKLEFEEINNKQFNVFLVINFTIQIIISKSLSA